MLKIKDITKCDSKGRVVIPKNIRRELAIQPGDQLDVILSEDDLVVLSKRPAEQVPES